MIKHKNTSNSIQILLVFQCVLLFGCDYVSRVPDKLMGCQYLDGAKGYNEMKQISEVGDTGNTMKIKKFTAFPIKEQIEIYLYSMRCMHNGRFIQFFYLDGQKKIPLILDRIQTTESVIGKADLIDALFHINKNCHCINVNSGVIESLDRLGKEIEENPFIAKQDKEIYNISLDSLRDQINKKINPN